MTTFYRLQTTDYKLLTTDFPLFPQKINLQSPILFLNNHSHSPLSFSMKKFLITLSTAVAASQMFVMKALAGLNDPPPVDGLSENTDIKSVAVDLLIRVLDLITLVAVIFVVVAGIRLIVSGGEEGEKDKAKKTIIYVIVGIVIILFARVIVTFFAQLA